MLKQRILTAIVLAGGLLSFILYMPFNLNKLLFSAVIAIAFFELMRLIGIKKPVILALVSCAAALIFYFMLEEMNAYLIYQAVMLASVFWFSIIIMMFLYQADTEWGIAQKWVHGVLASFLLFVSIGSLLFVHQHIAQGEWLFLYIMSIVWVADIGAYFSGKQFGKHKLAASISPGKSIEGVIGGLLLNVVWSWLVFTQWFQWNMSLLEFMAISLITSLISVPGDLYESILKRQAGMKDSGTILPGHGGLLDRIDSVIAAAPVFVLGLFVVGAV